MQINLLLLNQSLRWASLPVDIIKDGIEQVEIVLRRSTDWDGFYLTAQFQQEDEPINIYMGESDSVFFPTDVNIGKLNFSVFGVKGEIKRNVVAPLEFNVIESGYNGEGEVTPTPDLYNQLIERFETEVSKAEQAASDAENAANTAEQAAVNPPKIQNGNWYVWEQGTGYIDTGYPSASVITIGENGNWFVNGEDTGKPSRGETVIPEIGTNGNWIVGGEDTGKPSQGFSPTVQTKPIDNGTEVVITDKNGEKSFEVKDGKDGEPGAPGKNGADGITPNIQIGTVETLPPGSEATASITGEPENLKLNLGIPSGSTGEIWEEIGTIPLSPDIVSYELGEVDEWEKLRLFIARTYNKDLTGTVWLRVGSAAGANFTPGGLATQQYDMSVNNLHQFEVKIIRTNNSQVGDDKVRSYPIKAPGFVGIDNYPYAPGDKYKLIAATDASLCFDGTETARLYGVRRK